MAQAQWPWSVVRAAQPSKQALGGVAGGGGAAGSGGGVAAGGGQTGMGAPYSGPLSPINPNVGQPAQANVKKPSDQRFRSFAERYMIARAHLFRVPAAELTADTWECVMDAKRAYAMIERAGQNIEPEEGVF